MEITFMRPQGPAGAAAAKLLSDAKISFTTIFKGSDSRTSLHVEGQSFSWQGLVGIKRYIATLTS